MDRRNQVPHFIYAAGIVVAIILFFKNAVDANPTTVAISFLLAILVVSTVWSLAVSVFMSVAATLAFNFYFLPPFGTFTIADPQNWVALGAFLVTAIIASQLSETARAEARNATERRQEVERLYAFSRQLLVTGNMAELLNAIPGNIVQCFFLDAAALLVSATGVVYRSGPDLDGERLKITAAREETHFDHAGGRTFLPLRMGVRCVGALGLAGPPNAIMSRQTLDALGTLVAIAIERAHALEELSKAEGDRQSERLRTALVDSVAHELRTPLTSIKASVTTLLAKTDLADAQRRELLTVIEEESDRLNHLVEEASEMARLDAGEIELSLESGAIRPVIDAALERAKPLLAGRPVEVKVPGNTPAVIMDSERVQEVLLQLLENASKYSPAGSLIEVGAEANGKFSTVSVADRGPGIDEAEQALIFDKFYRGREQQYEVQGTGMGLAIAKAIVEAHGGTIGVTSQVGRGSVFHFTLPTAPTAS